ncbi:MAG: hemoglobin [Candidatus Azotimanducaceae bacterium]|jgi:hemoglobin
MSQSNEPGLGIGSATYDAVGKADGVGSLIDAFYTLMEKDKKFVTIWTMHQRSGAEARDRLARFLSAWMGGPRTYSETYGPINIPGVHGHLDIGVTERDLWLECMNEAMIERGMPETLRRYLNQQLSVPANRIVERCAKAK